MKIKIGILLFCFFLHSCGEQVFTYLVRYQKGEIKYKYNVPDGYRLRIWTGGYEDAHEFWYPDSSVFYITKERGLPSLAYYNIRAIPNAYAKSMLFDTITFSGIDSANRAWKHVEAENFSYGYSNVSNANVEVFEKILLQIEKQRPKTED
jgi:hypothetical protein